VLSASPVMLPPVGESEVDEDVLTIDVSPLP
jgi:hypothetical protein